MTTRPLLIVGLEAADGGLLRRLVAEGQLPTLSSILDRGSWGTLAGPEMVSEHGVWVSLLSGVSRGKHGYYYWRPLVPGTYDLRLTDLEALGVEPFWGRLRGS
ncbi:MAG TPA: hypothetical protein VEY33_06065, partial [Gemmatimonadota bacterium]|nr:hypothetical protein [Gemmatimonadota bacterium]